jgi:hypothetical protein
MTTVHLHRDDVPDTLALLGALLGDRSTEVPGYSLDETGADVDWDLLLEGSENGGRETGVTARMAADPDGFPWFEEP